MKHHVQISVDIARWSDAQLDGLVSDATSGKPLNAAELRQYIAVCVAEGLEVLPCPCATHGPTGRCPGFSEAPHA